MSPHGSEKPHIITISTGTFVKTVLIILALCFLWFVRDILAVVFVAALLAALIDPAADWCVRHKIPRGLAVIAVYIILLGIITAAAFLLVPAVVAELSEIVTNVPNSPLMGYLDHLRTFTTEHGLQDNVSSALVTLQNDVTGSISSIFSTLGGLVSAVATVFVVLVLAFYMVVEDEATRRSFRHLAPEEYRPYLMNILLRMQKKVGAWLRGQLLIGLIVGVAEYIGLTILGVHYALLLAVLGGLFELIPYLGPVLATIPAVLLALGQSPFTALCVLILYLVVLQVEGNFLAPKIMQKIVGLNPIVSIIALLIGVEVGGVLGAFLAIPIATMLSVLLDDLITKPVADEPL